MTVARSSIVDDESQGMYHCVARCVRRAFLCGWDAYSGKDYEHRKAWVRDRLELLSRSFGIDVFAHAVDLCLRKKVRFFQIKTVGAGHVAVRAGGFD